jgi:hypothetical protein
MDLIQIITVLIPTAATAIVGVILKNQIDSQKQTISDLKEYINTTSWKEVKDYYETHKVPTEKEITRQQVINEYGSTTEQYNELIDDYNELLNYFHTVMKGLNEVHPNFAKDRILSGLPRNTKYFRDIWQGDTPQTHDIENNL